MPKPRLAAFPAALFLAGLGLSLYYADAWWRLPTYSEAEVMQSVELNLAIDLRREIGNNSPPLTEDSVRMRRQQLESEIRREIATDRRVALRNMLVGLAVLLAAIVQLKLLTRWNGANSRQ